MTLPATILTDADLARRLPADEDAGFGALTTPRGCLPLQALDVHARIDGLLVQTTVTQTFVNTLAEPLEATYIFPLPDRAAVTAFHMELAGRVIEGVLKERGQARRDYEEALQAGHRAGITEEERPGVFTLRVGNLLPGEQAVVRLTLAGPLSYDAGEATFRFPLVVAPRYIPGTPLPGPSVGDGVAWDTDAVPDASRISPPVLLPGFPNPVRLSLTVDLRSADLPASAFRSSLHAFLTEEAGHGWRIRLEPGERLDRDFVLRYRLGDAAVKTSLTLVPDEQGPEGTFVLTLLPPAGQARPPRPRQLVFVLDRSGSMGGWKMVAARRALGRMVDTLTERDRFTVYAFDDTIETPPEAHGPGLIPASDRNRFRTIEFLARIDARGGTEMARPLDQAVRQLTAAAEGDRVLVLVTDGQVGNEDQILRSLGQRLDGIRVFTLGIDQAVNEAFLRRLAALGGGSCDVVESEDRLDEVMDKVQRRVGAPVLTGLHVEPSGLRLDPASLVPARLPDLFPGSPLTVLGRYRGVGGSVWLGARDEAGRAWSQTISGRISDSRAAAPVWARGYLRGLEDRYVLGVAEPEKLAKEIVDVSLRFGVLCRFTAYVAVDRSEVANAGGKQHHVVQPVEAPAGWEMLARGGPGSLAGAQRYLGAPAAAASQSAFFGSCFACEQDAEDGEAASLQEVAPAAPPAPRRARGLWRFGGGRRQAKQDKAAPADGVELAAYRQTARALLEALLASAAGDRVHALGVLSVQLAALIEDLKSVGAPAAELDPLTQLEADLRQLLCVTNPAHAEVSRVWDRAEAVLRAFAGEASAATGAADRRRGSFWK
jgi:Ca-activated chloride channel family protein